MNAVCPFFDVDPHVDIHTPGVTKAAFEQSAACLRDDLII